MPLIPTGIKTSDYPALPNDFVPVNASGASVRITLPNAPSPQTQIGVETIAIGGSHTVTVVTSGSDVVNKPAGPTSLDLSSVAGVLLQYEALAHIWYVQATSAPNVSSVATAGSMFGDTSTIVNVKYPPPGTLAATGDGSTDDTPAIQACHALLTNGGLLYFPAGTYLYSGSVTPLPNVTWLGAGPGASLLKRKTGASVNYVVSGTASNPYTSPFANITFRALGFDLNGLDSDFTGFINITGTDGCRVKDCLMFDSSPPTNTDSMGTGDGSTKAFALTLGNATRSRKTVSESLVATAVTTITGDTHGNITVDNLSVATLPAGTYPISGTDIPANTTLTIATTGATSGTLSNAATGSHVGATLVVTQTYCDDGEGKWVAARSQLQGQPLPGLSCTGDTYSSTTLDHLSVTLPVGAIFAVSGPGISPHTYATVLAGGTSAMLTAPATATASVTLTFTGSISYGSQVNAGYASIVFPVAPDNAAAVSLTYSECKQREYILLGSATNTYVEDNILRQGGRIKVGRPGSRCWILNNDVQDVNDNAIAVVDHNPAGAYGIATDLRIDGNNVRNPAGSGVYFGGDGETAGNDPAMICRRISICNNTVVGDWEQGILGIIPTTTEQVNIDDNTFRRFSNGNGAGAAQAIRLDSVTTPITGNTHSNTTLDNIAGAALPAGTFPISGMDMASASPTLTIATAGAMSGTLSPAATGSHIGASLSLTVTTEKGFSICRNSMTGNMGAGIEVANLASVSICENVLFDMPASRGIWIVGSLAQGRVDGNVCNNIQFPISHESGALTEVGFSRNILVVSAAGNPCFRTTSAAGAITRCHFSGQNICSGPGSAFSNANINSSDLDIENNDWSGCAQSPGIGTLAPTAEIRNNDGYNPFGSVTVLVPATTVAISSLNFDRDFYVAANATGSCHIAIQGGPSNITIAPGQTCHVFLPAGKTLTPTYGNAPTWSVYAR
jgi:hypothetical protein